MITKGTRAPSPTPAYRGSKNDQDQGFEALAEQLRCITI